MKPLEARSLRRPDVMMVGLRSIGRGQGGVEAHVEQLSEELDSAGYAVEVIVRTPYSGPSTTIHAGATRVVPIWSPKGRSTEAIVHSLLSVFYAAIRRPRILHIHAVGPSLVIPVARALGLRVVFTHHGEDYNREKWGKIAKFALRMGERIGALLGHERICVSPSLSRSLSAKYRVPFRYIPNGVKSVLQANSSSLLSHFGLRKGRYILHVGRVVPEKRQADLISAMQDLKEENLKLVLVGAADHASDYSRHIDGLIDGSSNIIKAGFRSGIDLAELYSNAGLFVLPSTHEGLPIALLEAMSYGCPVIVSDIDANLNIGLPENSYFPVTDVSAIAEKIDGHFRCNKTPSRVDWGNYLASFNWREIAAKTAEVYNSAATSELSGNFSYIHK